MGQPENSQSTTIPVKTADETQTLPLETQVETEVQLTSEQIAEAKEQALLEAIYADVDKGKNPFEIAVAHNIVDQQKILEISIRRHYQCGRGSIQDYARIYNLTVQAVLSILEQDEGQTVTLLGDQIDSEEVGMDIPLNTGTKIKIPYDLS